MITEKTIKKPGFCEGIGIHSGKKIKLLFKPADIGTGIVFYRTDIKKSIKVTPKNLQANSRATILQENEARILTPEHLLATCFAFGISNLIIEMDQEEVPIMDGSAAIFYALFKKCGIVQQNKSRSSLIITQPLVVKDNDVSLMALPHKSFKITFVVEYAETFIGKQIFSLEINKASFIREIAFARTYGFYAELAPLLERGLAKGATMDNAVVIGTDKYLNDLRFEDELVRHKILDLIGDLAILGKPICGHIIAIKSGHAFNAKFIQLLD